MDRAVIARPSSDTCAVPEDVGAVLRRRLPPDAADFAALRRS
jgi:hypothetical protein